MLGVFFWACGGETAGQGLTRQLVTAGAPRTALPAGLRSLFAVVIVFLL